MMPAAHALELARRDLHAVRGRAAVLAILRQLQGDLVGSSAGDIGEFVVALIAALEPANPRKPIAKRPIRQRLAAGEGRGNIIPLIGEVSRRLGFDTS